MCLYSACQKRTSEKASKPPKWQDGYEAIGETVREKEIACINTAIISTEKVWEEMVNLIHVRAGIKKQLSNILGPLWKEKKKKVVLKFGFYRNCEEDMFVWVDAVWGELSVSLVLWSGRFWMSLKMETLQFVWANSFWLHFLSTQTAKYWI